MASETLHFTCMSCGRSIKAPASAAGKRGRCKCGALNRIPTPAATGATEEPPQIPTETPPSHPLARKLAAGAAPEAGHVDEYGEQPEQDGQVERDVRDAHPCDHPTRIAVALGCAFLLLLAFSPFLAWMNLLTGRQLGISGDGKIVLGLSMIAAVAVGLAYLLGKGLKAAALVAAAWGTVALFWMAALIFRVATITNMEGLSDNPFAAVLATQISPGAGLYVGLVGSVGVLAAFIFTVRRHPSEGHGLRRHAALVATQASALVLGSAIVMFYWHTSRLREPEPIGPGIPRAGGADSREGKVNPKADADVRAYIHKVELRNVEVGRTTRDEIFVAGEVKNLGDRTLHEVQIGRGPDPCHEYQICRIVRFHETGAHDQARRKCR